MPANLTARKFTLLLEKIDACQEGMDWAKGKDYATAWATCDRGDWMLQMIDDIAPLDAKINELLVCRFARQVVHLNDDPHVLACIEVREAWARGAATGMERAIARAAIGGSPCHADQEIAAPAARAAAWSTARYAAGDAAGALAGRPTRDAAGAAARIAVWAAARATQADIIRELIPMPALA